jgi:hypothetical protein
MARAVAVILNDLRKLFLLNHAAITREACARKGNQWMTIAGEAFE